jgi:uncharacterized Zn-binding protein involved in type VI secretion
MTTARGLLVASAMLAGLALAGLSRAKDRVHDSENTSNKETAMTHPVDESRNFTLTFRSEMDRVAPGLYAHMEVTRVDGRSGRAVMLVNRPGSDVAGVPVVPHVGGPIVGPGAPQVLIGGLPAAVVGDMCVCAGPPDAIIMGSSSVLISGKPAARVGDPTAHGGTILPPGFVPVMIGG